MTGIAEILTHAHALADAMGKISAQGFYKPITVTTKSDKTFVTEVDKATEQTAREYLAQYRPNDKIWGEEFGKNFEAPEANDITWVIDPIDGTKAFMDGLAFWTNLIGVFKGTELLLGIINQPITGERYWGGPALPSRYFYMHDGKRIEEAIKCSTETSLEKLSWRTTTADYFRPELYEGFDALANIEQPREGGDAMLYAALARGRTINCVFDDDLAAWDIAAPAAVVLGAGGVVTDATGQPIDYFSNSKTSVLAAGTRELHQHVLKVIS